MDKQSKVFLINLGIYCSSTKQKEENVKEKQNEGKGNGPHKRRNNNHRQNRKGKGGDRRKGNRSKGQKGSKREPYQVPIDEKKKRVVLHRQPHGDEVLCLSFLLTRKGRKAFPNVFPNGELDFSRIEFVDRNDLPNNRTYKQRPAALHVGCGGDPRFDEHVCDNPNWEAACTLMARHLGLLNHPWWKRTIEDVRREDREGRATNGEIAYAMKGLYDTHGGTPEGDQQVIEWGMLAYETQVKSLREEWLALKDVEKNPRVRGQKWDQRLRTLKPMTTKTARVLMEEAGEEKLDWFLKLARESREIIEMRRRHAREHFLDQAECRRFELKEGVGIVPKGTPIRFFSIISDNAEMANVCWRKFSADVLVIRRKSGHTAIMTRHDLGLDLTELHAELERLEAEMGNSDADWILPSHRGKILNGSQKFKGVTPSELPLSIINEAVERCLSHEAVTTVGMAFSQFESEFAKLDLEPAS